MQEQNAELREFIIQLEIEVAELTIICASLHTLFAPK
jgi:hypothetical protein